MYVMHKTTFTILEPTHNLDTNIHVCFHNFNFSCLRTKTSCRQNHSRELSSKYFCQRLPGLLAAFTWRYFFSKSEIFLVGGSIHSRDAARLLISNNVGSQNSCVVVETQKWKKMEQHLHYIEHGVVKNNTFLSV
jgi:hypothetical protein